MEETIFPLFPRKVACITKHIYLIEELSLACQLHPDEKVTYNWISESRGVTAQKVLFLTCNSSIQPKFSHSFPISNIECWCRVPFLESILQRSVEVEKSDHFMLIITTLEGAEGSISHF